jgi:hypothetical protein
VREKEAPAMMAEASKSSSDSFSASLRNSRERVLHVIQDFPYLQVPTTAAMVSNSRLEFIVVDFLDHFPKNCGYPLFADNGSI